MAMDSCIASIQLKSRTKLIVRNSILFDDRKFIGQRIVDDLVRDQQSQLRSTHKVTKHSTSAGTSI